jgi:PEP-CTERM motif
MPALSQATTSFLFNSTTPDTLVDVRFTADLTISGNNLTVVLTNDSMNHTNGPSFSRNPNDLITSFYFDIFNGFTRPTLTYTGATGDVCLVLSAAADNCAVTQEPGDGSNEADLRAIVAGDHGWQFKDNFTLTFGSDTLTFGIGTAGNMNMAPNNFMGNIVDGFDYGIYAGTTGTATEVTPSLNGRYLAYNSITYTFTGVSGYTEADIGPKALFGLGTMPDSTGLVPEPSTGLMLALGLVGLAYRRRG